MSEDPDLDQVKSYFDKCIREHGATPRGVNWNSQESQNLRFKQFLKLIQERSFSLLDYGCSYGAFADYLTDQGLDVDYYGFDILESAIEEARRFHVGKPQRTFFSDPLQLTICDYVVASGVFNYRADASFVHWTDHVVHTLHEFNRLSIRGFASNFLTKYSDTDKMRPDLYYADPLFLFDYCKMNFSRNISILHDYEIYDFTLLVRK